MSCRFDCSVSDLVYHQYGICCMYSEENPQYFGLPVPCLYPCKQVVLLLCTEASFKPGGSFFREFISENLFQGFIPGALPLRTKEVDIPYFVQNFLLTLLAYMESAATYLTLAFMSFCCMRMQSFRRIPSLKALKERCSMNDIPSIS